jgi:hypothetical protein
MAHFFVALRKIMFNVRKSGRLSQEVTSSFVKRAITSTVAVSNKCTPQVIFLAFLIGTVQIV